MKRVIIDSSSLILMHKCSVVPGLLEYCIPVIPESVLAELTVPGHDGAEYFQGLFDDKRVIVYKPEESGEYGLTGALHSGERDVIALFYEKKGEYIIIDDRHGAAYCRDKSIPYINALLAVKILFTKKIITENEYSDAWKWLVTFGRYSGKIISWAESAGDKLLAGFI